MKIYKNIEYVIWRNPIQLYYCAYVKLPKGHKWIDILSKINVDEYLTLKKSFEYYNYQEIPVKCHGGLTFGTKIKNNQDKLLSKGWWIGWDYAHGNLNDYIPAIYKENNMKLKVWSEKEIEKEIEKVIILI